MKERPLLLGAPMVRATLSDLKTNTRRIMKHQPPHSLYEMSTLVDTTGDPREKGKHHWILVDKPKIQVIDGSQPYFACPYGKVGDRLWVREAWGVAAEDDPFNATQIMEQFLESDYRSSPIEVRYEADGTTQWKATKVQEFGRYRHARFMPRWASRLTLEITDIRVERLNDISEEDALAEGIERSREILWRDYSLKNPADGGFYNPRASFISLWQSINGADSWTANPWVWVLQFKRVEAIS